MFLKITVIILFAVSILFGGIVACSSYKEIKPPPIEGKVKAHWMKKGEKAPFSGILLTKDAYGRIMEKIYLLEEQLRQCQENR